MCLFYTQRKKKKIFLKKNIVIEPAPEPEEIQFENLEITSYERFFRTLLIYLISIVIIVICFFLISRLNLIQKEIKDKEDSYNIFVKYFVSFIITIVISIMDEIFKNILEILTKMEKHITITNYYLSVSIKLTIFTFITSSILPLVSNYINNKGDYNLLVANMLILFLSNSFITPIMWTLNFKYFLKKFLQFIIERKNNHYYTQIELNNLYELPNMNISYKYSYLAKSLLMSFLYIPIFPLGIIISLLGLILGYFLEKYNFIKMYKRPEMLNSNLCEFYSNYFIINFFMLGLGDYIFLETKENNNTWKYVNTHVFVLLMIIPYNQIFAFDFIGIKEYQLKNAKNYEDEYFNFYNDYERSNPMTKKEGMKHFIYRLKEKHYINLIDEAILRNINNINLMEVYYKSKQNYNNFLIQREFSVYNSEKGKREYKSILRQFTKGNLLRNFIFKNIKNNEEQQNKNEENVETTENKTDEIGTIKKMNMENVLKNYFQTNDKDSKNSNSILNEDNFEDSIKTTINFNDLYNNNYYKDNGTFNKKINITNIIEKDDNNNNITNIISKDNNNITNIVSKDNNINITNIIVKDNKSNSITNIIEKDNINNKNITITNIISKEYNNITNIISKDNNNNIVNNNEENSKNNNRNPLNNNFINNNDNNDNEDINSINNKSTFDVRNIGESSYEQNENFKKHQTLILKKYTNPLHFMGFYELEGTT